jgi:hypothetical protein
VISVTFCLTIEENNRKMTKLDNKEKELLKSYENYEWVSVKAMVK